MVHIPIGFFKYLLAMFGSCAMRYLYMDLRWRLQPQPDVVLEQQQKPPEQLVADLRKVAGNMEAENLKLGFLDHQEIRNFHDQPDPKKIHFIK